jgi:hypothetical protein
LARLDSDIRRFKTDLYRIGWFMRGSITINDLLFSYSHEDRELISKVIDENIENSVKSGMPLI